MKILILDPYFESLGGGEKVIAVMAEHLSTNNEVSVLIKNPLEKSRVEKYFNVNLSSVKFEFLPKEKLITKLLTSQYSKLPGRWKSILYDLDSVSALKKLKPDLFINGLYQSNLPSPVKNSIYLCMFPQRLGSEINRGGIVRKSYNKLTNGIENITIGNRQRAINSYSVVAANSKYTAGWISKYWKRDAEVLYPVCDDMGPPANKKNMILTVGRFFPDNGSSHHKRHDMLIDAFLELNEKDWELHIAGSLVENDKHDVSYFNYLKKKASKASNIYIHPNMPFEELKKLRQETSIYWHATGYGYDTEKFPENQEHFGMSTVEAMSAGAIPIVYDSAGQREIVDNRENGFLWRTNKELLEKTQEVIGNVHLRVELSKNSVSRSKDFNRQHFFKNVDKLINKLSD
jgi:glycosyltransferase involved in cell wall biosynthesis